MKAGSVLLTGGFTAAGAVRLLGAEITSQLACSGARLTGADRDGNTLVADGMKAGGDVFLTDGFTAAGESACAVRTSPASSAAAAPG